MFKKVTLILVTLFLIPILAFASEVILKSGKKIEGQIVEQTDQYVKISPDTGIILKFNMNEIASMGDDSTDAVKNNTACQVTMLNFFSSDKNNLFNAQMNEAIDQVQNIINQPVTSITQDSGMQVETYSPGWFHPGAIKPDFNTVDVRKTQQFPYKQYQYVTSDLNQGQVFIGSDLEFNPMTKYFYTDRTVPKKKLSEDEMLEINRLYRIIGRCQGQLGNV